MPRIAVVSERPDAELALEGVTLMISEGRAIESVFDGMQWIIQGSR